MLLELPDRQQVRGKVLRRRREPTGWWYEIEVQLWTRTQLADRQVVAEPGPVTCWAPAGACAPIEGQDYSAVIAERPNVAPAWLLEEMPGGQLVVHRSDCNARHEHSTVRPADAAAVQQVAAARHCPARSAGRSTSCAHPVDDRARRELADPAYRTEYQGMRVSYAAGVLRVCFQVC